MLVLFVVGVPKTIANTPYKDSILLKKINSLEKSVFIGYDFGQRILIGFSGPQLLFKVSHNLKIGPAYFPALWWDYKTGEKDTKLGVGIRADHKSGIIAFNTFRVGNRWLGSLLVGCRF